MKKYKFLAVLFLFSLLIINANGQKSVKAETIKGTVIAHQPFAQLLCVWHPCAVWLIVKVQDKKQTKYVRVDVEYFPNLSLPNRGLPSELTKDSRTYKFKAIRDKSRDTVLKKYLNVVDENENDVSGEAALPAWKLLSGAEDEKLPFGEVLSNYEVKANRFKLLRQGK